MDLSRQVARMFGVGFDGPSIPNEIDALISRGVRCVILFKRNVESAKQVRDLCANLKRRAGGEPLAMTIDHEGGRVLRLRGEFTDIPSAREVGRANNIDLTRQMGQLMGRELRAVNIDVDFAPVLDVDTNANNPVIANRSFGPDPKIVASLGCAIVEGLQSQGVAACGKHFPGHGDTSQDSHFEMPRIDHERARLERVELPPFQAAIDAGVATIMTSHILFTAIDPELPATMSEKILQGILRQQLRFDGPIISDDLEMKAIAGNFGVEQVMIRGAIAGIDLFLICHNHTLQNQAIDMLTKAVERGDVPLAAIERANRRIDQLMSSYVLPPSDSQDLSLIGCPEHLAIVDRLRELAGPEVREADPTEQWRLSK